MSALAAEVQSRGHDVVFVSIPDAEARAVDAGLRFLTVGTEHLPFGITKMVEKQFSVTQGKEKRYIMQGPFVNEQLRPSVEFKWDRLNGAPLVYASMGTLQNGIESVFRHILEAASGLKDIQFVVAMGNKLDHASFGQIPENVLLVDFAPQLELLKRASLCITHAGLNTVLESLINGVPLVALPVTNDQPGVAARIRTKGVGDFLRLRSFP